MFSIFLAALTTFFAIRKTQDRNITLIATTSFAALYWVTQALAIVYPGTAFMDPEFDTPRAYLLGLPRRQRSTSLPYLSSLSPRIWQL